MRMIFFLNQDHKGEHKRSRRECILNIRKPVVSIILFSSMWMSLQAEEHTGEIPEGYECRKLYAQAWGYASNRYNRMLYGTYEVSIKKEGDCYIW